MASDVTAIERLEDRPIGVDPGAIEQEFTRIWRETSGAGFDESSIRLRVLNFVALGAHQDDLARFEDVMQSLPQRYPCRGIAAIAEPGREELAASISAHCWHSPGERRHVCSEEVALRGGAAQHRALASAVLALLVPEVPVSLWLLGDLAPARYLWSVVLEEGDQLMFDSADPHGSAASLRAASVYDGDAALADLAWWRTETWRTLAAQLFDGAEGPRELEQIAEIEVTGGERIPSIEALLFGSWLVSRLGLSLADVSRYGNAYGATFYRGTRGIRLAVRPSLAAGAPVEELKIRTSDAEFVIQHHAESRHIHVRENWEGGPSRRTVDHPPMDDATLILRALDGGEDPQVYLDAVQLALALAE